MLSHCVRNFAKKYALGIELGGQTAAIAVAEKVGEFIYKKKGIPTREPITPDEAMKNIITEVKKSGYEIDRIGIASFGPLNLYEGKIGGTPKPLWPGFPLVKAIQKEFPDARVVLETDVNAPAYSEYLKLKEKDPTIKSVAYATIGTGVGVGLFTDGKPLHGTMHPECGHFRPRKMEGDNFPGVCPYHGDCVEGHLGAPSIAARLGIKPNELAKIPDDHIVWKYFAEYAGQLAGSCALAYSLDAFVIGGGITTAPGREFLIKDIQKATEKFLNNYIKVPKVILPAYGGDSGLVGATAVAINGDLFDVNK